MLRPKSVALKKKPPDPKNGNPGAVGTATGVKNSKQKSRKKHTPRPTTAQAGKRFLSVYSGREFLGGVRGGGSAFVVVLPHGTLLGTFKSLRAAADAISAAQGGAR